METCAKRMRNDIICERTAKFKLTERRNISRWNRSGHRCILWRRKVNVREKIMKEWEDLLILGLFNPPTWSVMHCVLHSCHLLLWSVVHYMQMAACALCFHLTNSLSTTWILLPYSLWWRLRLLFCVSTGYINSFFLVNELGNADCKAVVTRHSAN
jgi:hypothetical protein